jgi:dolichol-phosphate mannosyltransferase
MDLASEMTKNLKARKEQKVEIIIPTLNEESSIRELIKDIKNYNCIAQNSILVIDGGSTDKTVEICNDENVTVLQQRRKGKGSAMREAVDATDTDVIVFIDGDGTYSINDLNSLLEPVLSDKADMVVGSRVLGNREKGSISKFNYIGNKLFNKTINFSLKSNVTDSLSGYRVLRREVFRELILFSDSFEIEVEMTVEALAKGYRVKEIPIKYGKRKESQTKLNPLSDGIKISKTLLFITMNINPIKFFGLITVGFFLMSLIPISQILYEKIILGNIISMPSVILSTLLFITGIMSLIIGLVSELVVRSRRRIEYLIGHKN